MFGPSRGIGKCVAFTDTIPEYAPTAAIMRQEDGNPSAPFQCLDANASVMTIAAAGWNIDDGWVKPAYENPLPQASPSSDTCRRD